MMYVCDLCWAVRRISTQVASLVMYDVMDPYAILLEPSGDEVWRTPTMKDAGRHPVWDAVADVRPRSVLGGSPYLHSGLVYAPVAGDERLGVAAGAGRGRGLEDPDPEGRRPPPGLRRRS